jgi:ribosomal protein L37AE/L43A
MKRVTWTCDRCGVTVAVDRAMLTGEVFGAAAAQGWSELWDAERRTDVCPGCLTDRERADALLDEIEIGFGV